MSNAVTDEMIDAGKAAYLKCHHGGADCYVDTWIAAIISAAISAAQAQPVDEQWRYRRAGTPWSAWQRYSPTLHSYADFEKEMRPLYLHPPVQVPVVKALTWREWTGSQRGWQAESAIGQYQVCWLGEYECWQCSRPHKAGNMRGDDFSRHEKRAEAWAAAQSDYEARIRSALVGVVE